MLEVRRASPGKNLGLTVGIPNEPEGSRFPVEPLWMSLPPSNRGIAIPFRSCFMAAACQEGEVGRLCVFWGFNRGGILKQLVTHRTGDGGDCSVRTGYSLPRGVGTTRMKRRG